ncbi:MAG: HNH endonuclease [Cyanobium sp.]
MPPPPSATYQRLRLTIAERMRFSHVVPPRRRAWPAGSWGAHGGQGSPSTASPAASAAAPAVAQQTPHQRALDVAPIVPRNHGGTGDLSNLQALCFRCNASQLRRARGRLCVLRAGGQRPGAAGERIRSCAPPMPIQVRCFQRWGSWRPCRAITRISVPCSRK